MTPDHVLRTKRLPLIFDNEDLEGSVESYKGIYTNYFQRFSTPDLEMLDRHLVGVNYPITKCLGDAP